MKYIDADQIRAEIERRLKAIANSPSDGGEMDAINGARCLELMSFRKYIDTFPEQPVEGLEEEITRYLREECSSDNEPSVSEIARHFAEWGRKDKEDK